jgi:hypothetical protein
MASGAIRRDLAPSCACPVVPVVVSASASPVRVLING